MSNKSLMSSLKEAESPPEEALHKALAMAAKRGTILHLALDRDGEPEDIYLVNDEPSRQTKTKIESGEINLSGLEPKEPALVDAEERPNIFTLYEQNIGMLTPMIREELVDALKVYPESWIGDAIKEAVNQNIRKKSYILAILERWASEGRDDGTYRGDSKKTGPDKYIKGKYGHIVQR
jgi:DnaD/phage-associated family protein